MQEHTKYCTMLLITVYVLIIALPSFAEETRIKGVGLSVPQSSDKNIDTKDKPDPEYQLNSVEVKAKRQAKEGSAEAGYKVDTAKSTGLWGQKSLQDTPYSINVMSSDLITNIGASSPDQLFRINPLTQVYSPQARAGNVPINVRGFRSTTATLVDGMRGTAGYSPGHLRDHACTTCCGGPDTGHTRHNHHQDVLEHL